MSYNSDSHNGSHTGVHILNSLRNAYQGNPFSCHWLQLQQLKSVRFPWSSATADKDSRWLWTFCQCWKDLPVSLSTFPKIWVMAIPHSSICNCLFRCLEIYINPAQALLLTHLMPLPSMYFVFLYEISSWAWYRNCSFSKSFSINSARLNMFLQPQLLQRQSLYMWGYTKRLPVLTQSVLKYNLQATNLLTCKAPSNELINTGAQWNPNSSVNNVFLIGWSVAICSVGKKKAQECSRAPALRFTHSTDLGTLRHSASHSFQTS